MKITIDIRGELPSAEATKPKPKPSLQERIDYAVDCFLCNHEPEAAYTFIEKVNNKIQSKAPGSLTAADKQILRSIKEIITLHGFKRNTIINSSHMKDI